MEEAVMDNYKKVIVKGNKAGCVILSSKSRKNTATKVKDKRFAMLLMFSIAMFFMISSVCAESDGLQLNPFANKKIIVPTDTAYPDIQISKTFFWFESDKIAEYKLKYNTDTCLINCKMGGDAILYVNGKLFDDAKFKYTWNDREISLQDYSYWIRGEDEIYSIDVDDYKQECVPDPESHNNSQICTNKIIGTHKEERTREVWNRYGGEELGAGSYQWELRGVKDPSQTVDAIPLAQEKTFDEWAVWTSSFNVGLKTYYNMDTVADNVNGRFNLTLQGNAVVDQAGGIISKFADNDGASGSYFNISHGEEIVLNESYGWAINLWLKTSFDSATGSYKVLTSFGKGGDSNPFLRTFEYGNKPYVNYQLGSLDCNCGASCDAVNDNNWRMETYVLNQTAVTIYQNGAYKFSCDLSYGARAFNLSSRAYFTAQDPTSRNYDVSIDEVGIWNRTLTPTEISDLWNGELTYVADTVPTMTATASYPINAFNTTTSAVGIGCNFTTTLQNVSSVKVNVTLANVQAYSNTISSLTVPSYNATWTTSALADGTYLWNCTGYGSAGINETSATRTFTIDTSAPTFTLVSLNNVSTISLPVNATINVTTTDINTENCSYWTSDNVTATVYPCNISQDILFLTGGSKNITVYANDSFGNSNSTTYFFRIYDFNVTQSGDASAGDGTEHIFTLLINSTSFPIIDANANLWYNGANKGYITKTALDLNSIYFTKTLIIPSGTGNSTGKGIDWYWRYNTTELTTRNTTTQTQTVYNISITDCDVTSGIVILNMSLKDEETNDLVNITSPNTAVIEIDLDITSLSNSSMAWNFHKKWEGNNSVAICVPNELLNLSTYRIDFTAGYDATDHVREFYYLENGTLDNTDYFNSYTDNTIDLMDLASADSTTFLFSFTDADNQEVDDILVHTFRKYIGEGLFREVERSKQDNAGQTHVHLVEEDVIYYFMITQFGNIIYTSDTYNAKCLSTPCEISLSASPTETNWSIIDNQGGKYSITSNKNTRLATMTFSIDASDLVNFSLYSYNGANATFINGTSLTAMSGSVGLNVPLAYGNKTFFAVVYRNNTFVKSQWIDLTDRGQDYFGTFGAILGGLIVLSMMLMAVSEGAGFIIFTILALLIVGIMKLVDLNWMAIISIICAGGIILWKLVNRRNKVN